MKAISSLTDAPISELLKTCFEQQMNKFQGLTRLMRLFKTRIKLCPQVLGFDQLLILRSK